MGRQLLSIYLASKQLKGPFVADLDCLWTVFIANKWKDTARSTFACEAVYAETVYEKVFI